MYMQCINMLSSKVLYVLAILSPDIRDHLLVVHGL